jgi:hypothetical protein
MRRPPHLLARGPGRVRSLRSITIAGRRFSLPRSRAGRVALGVGLVVGGFVGFLPVLGFWMLPLGLIVLSVDLALVRRHRRRLQVWWGRRRASSEAPREGVQGER